MATQLTEDDVCGWSALAWRGDSYTHLHPPSSNKQHAREAVRT